MIASTSQRKTTINRSPQINFYCIRIYEEELVNLNVKIIKSFLQFNNWANVIIEFMFRFMLKREALQIFIFSQFKDVTGRLSCCDMKIIIFIADDDSFIREWPVLGQIPYNLPSLVRRWPMFGEIFCFFTSLFRMWSPFGHGP